MEQYEGNAESREQYWLPLARRQFARLLGVNYRADVWCALERNPEATPAQIARIVGCAYETARSVAEDFRLLQRARAVA